MNSRRGSTSDPPSSPPAPLSVDKVAFWYCPVAHAQKLGTPVQFFGQGFGLAMRLEPFVPFLAENYRFLSSALGPVHSYHHLRWNSSSKQRVPNGDADPKLTRNKLGRAGDPSDATIALTPP